MHKDRGGQMRNSVFKRMLTFDSASLPFGHRQRRPRANERPAGKGYALGQSFFPYSSQMTASNSAMFFAGCFGLARSE
jgi:hypothetical protein